jgi:transcriptional regulator with PAS, ATPase and Fis domain
MNKIVKAAMETRDVNEIGICFLADGLKFLVEKDISPKIMTLDFQMEGGELSKDVLESTKKFIEELEKKSAWRSTVILGISSHANESVAQELENIIRASGFSIYPKTDALYTLLPHILGDALSIHTLRLKSEAEGYKEGVKDTIGITKEDKPSDLPDNIIGKSPNFMKAIEIARKVAETNTKVLLLGETGVGKEVFAKYIHDSSNRNKKPFVIFDCGAVSEHLIESELFGHVKGAFTGATENKNGLLHEADKGTLFIDETGALDLRLQTRLLRFLQKMEFNKVGSVVMEKVDVRFIAATNKNLKDEVDNGRFREDLYYRLNVVSIEIPPLRKRKEDILPLAQYFLGKKSKDLGKIANFTDEAMEALKLLEYNGNVRELEHLIEGSIVLSKNGKITAELIKENYKGTIKGYVKSSSSDVNTKGNWWSKLDKEQLLDLCREIWVNRNKTGENNILYRSPVINKKGKEVARGRNHPNEIPRVIKAERLVGAPEHYIRAVLAIFWCFFEESEKPPEVTKQKFYDIFGFKGGGNFRGYLKNKSTTKSTSIFFPLREHVKGYGPPDLYLDGMLLKQNGIVLDIG